MKITTVDTHTEGQATRIVVAGIDDLVGDTMLARRRDFENRFDRFRVGLLSEPRGHRGLLGCVITEPCSPEADLGVFFMHNSGYLEGADHGILDVATALVETGIIESDAENTPVALDTPSGVIVASVRSGGGKVREVSFRNVPAWIGLLGASLHLPDRGEVIVDVAYGGDLCVSVWAEHLGIELSAGNFALATEAAMEVLEAANDKLVIRDPHSGDRRAITAATILDAPRHELPAFRGLQVYGPGQFERAPSVTAAGARLAAMFSRGEVHVGDDVTAESPVTERTMGCRLVEEVRAGERSAVITEVVGRAHVTGFHDFVFDSDDPFSEGLLLDARD